MYTPRVSINTRFTGASNRRILSSVNISFEMFTSVSIDAITGRCITITYCRIPHLWNANKRVLGAIE